MKWKPLNPASFENVVSENGIQFAKDEPYLNAIITLWKSEPSATPVATAPYVYYSSETGDEQQSPLFGHAVRRTRDRMSQSPLPGILLFHTGAGPQDVFLFYKAAVLLQDLDCVVLICDILSDESGWAWGADRKHYNLVRESLIANDASLLRTRVSAAAKALCKFKENDIRVDPQKLAAMGWCLGGQPIMELSKIGPSLVSSIPGFWIRSMVTFHGVFRRAQDGEVEDVCEEKEGSNSLSSEVLVCNGADDPFVSKEDLQKVKKLFFGQGFTPNIIEMEGAKHGFTNPAQSLNGNPAFEYNQVAATSSWDATMKLLKRTLI